MTLYSRVFKITGCDEFTRNFLGKLGVRVKQIAEPVPEDPFMQHRKAVSFYIDKYTVLLWIFKILSPQNFKDLYPSLFI